MDSPRYTATVTSVTRGWTYSYTQADGDAAPAPVHLLEGLTYSWGFVDDLIPGDLQTFTAGFSLLCDTADDIPDVEVGDLIEFAVRLGAAGTYIVAPPPMRVLSVEAEADPNPSSSVEVAVRLVDLSADWRAKALGDTENLTLSGGTIEAYNANLWRHRLAELARAVGLTIGRPEWWAPGSLDTWPWTPTKELAWRPAWRGDASWCLTELLNSHQPAGHTHTYATVYRPATDHPPGWEDLGADVANAYGFNYSVPDTAVKIEIVPATRVTPGAGVKLPFRLAVDADGVLGILPTTPPAPSSPGLHMTQLGVDAEWVDAPARWRRAREHAVNRITLQGQARAYGEDGSSFTWQTSTRTYDDTEAVDARGAITRVVPTDLFLGQDGNYSGFVSDYATYHRIVAERFMADDTAQAATWAMDSFTLYSSRMPQSAAESLLPRLAPRLPGETDGDGRVVRHVTLANIDGDITFTGAPMRGFIVAGTLSVVGGDLVWQLRITPGDPIFNDFAPTPITFTEWEAATAGVTFDEIGDNFRLGDLAYVDA